MGMFVDEGEKEMRKKKKESVIGEKG